MPDAPGRLVLIGDLHGNTGAAQAAVRDAAARLEGEPRKLALQVGDFGFWSFQDSYLRKLSKTLAENEMELWFLDGNHEHHDKLDQLMKRWQRNLDYGVIRTQEWEKQFTSHPEGAVRAAPGIWYLSRGTNWQWHDRTWLAVGGAVSVDKDWRTPGFDWFPQEAVTHDQVREILRAVSHADVVLTHDCPLGVDLHLTPGQWPEKLEIASANHRALLQMMGDFLQPSYWVHGHYHRWYEQDVKTPYGQCRVTGLNMDREQGNWMILDTKTMEWDWP